MNPRATRTMRSSDWRGFTLVELLVVVGIIAVLIGLLLPALSRARKASRQTVALSAMRDLLYGYTTYHQEHKGTLMWGYPPAEVGGQLVRVGLPTGQEIPTPGSGTYGSMSLPVQRYPARITPYQNQTWKILYNHVDPSALPAHGDTIDDAARKIYEISLYPSFGLNSVFLGGDLNFGGFISVPRPPPLSSIFVPNVGKHVAFKANEIKRATEQIVFVECQESVGTSRTDNGYFRAIPPVANGRKWKASPAGNQAESMTSTSQGVPYARWSPNRAVTGFFDGHAEPLTITQLDDMRLWAKNALTVDYDYKAQ